MDIQRESLRKQLEDCRQGTLALFQNLEADLFCQQIHPQFSPLGWHLGHVAFTEAYWILEQCQGLKPLFPEYRQLFAADGLPKFERQNLPSLEIIQNYLQTVRLQGLAYLEQAPLPQQERLWSWLLQHESQHSETIAFLLHLHRFNAQTPDPPKHLVTPNTTLAQSLHLPAGEFWMGSDRLEAQDNERPRHLVHLESYWIDAYPVTQGQYQVFIENGGYHQPKFWSEPGWQWRQSQAITQPLYWWEPGSRQDHPVYGVSWYEAQAYAGFVGKRLPTEAEWERAASQEDFWPKIPPLEAGCFPDSGEEGEGQLSPYLPNRWAENDLCPPDPGEAGGANPASPGRSIWEWTDSWFSPYPNFEAYPYPGYSQVYFDQQHRVLRGGSWVTRPWARRKTFRNWYQPGVREIFVGFRCAS